MAVLLLGRAGYCGNVYMIFGNNTKLMHFLISFFEMCQILHLIKPRPVTMDRFFLVVVESSYCELLCIKARTKYI